MGSRRSGALPLRRIRSPLVSSISPLTGAGIGPALLVPDRFVVCPRLPLGLSLALFRKKSTLRIVDRCAHLVEDVVDLAAADPDLVGQGHRLRVVDEVVELVDQDLQLSCSRIQSESPKFLSSQSSYVWRMDSRPRPTG